MTAFYFMHPSEELVSINHSSFILPWTVTKNLSVFCMWSIGNKDNKSKEMVLKKKKKQKRRKKEETSVLGFILQVL